MKTFALLLFGSDYTILAGTANMEMFAKQIMMRCWYCTDEIDNDCHLKYE